MPFLCRSSGAASLMAMHESPAKNFDLSLQVEDLIRNIVQASIAFNSQKRSEDLLLPAAIPHLRCTEISPGANSFGYGVPEPLLKLFRNSEAGLVSGHSPLLSAGGSGGVYFMPDEAGTSSVAIFKPSDEEPLAVNCPRGLPPTPTREGLKKGTIVGEGAIREVAAWLLDQYCDADTAALHGFAGVPPTMMVTCAHRSFSNRLGRVEEKVGSLQEFVHAFSNCEDMGPSNLPIAEVHKIAILDMRLANTDRNGANILVCKESGSSGGLKLVPIDHGYCLPEKFEDCTFEWLYWPQARVGFSESMRKYINSLDAERDLALLERHGWQLSPPCARVFRISTMMLKHGVSAGLTASQIGSMMVREQLSQKSDVEEMMEEVEQVLPPDSSEAAFYDGFKSVLELRIQEIVARKCRVEE